MTPDRSKAARELLAFYAEAGVDAAIGEQPNDFLSAAGAASGRRAAAGRGDGTGWRAGAPQTADARAGSVRRGPRLPPPPAPDAAVMAAREAARTASSLEELRAILDRFEGCGLKGSASRLVFADGTPGSRLMFVGEAPGAEEDKQGLPFVGRSGQLLDRMLKAIGLERAQGLHRQHRAVAAAGQSHAHAGRDANLPAVHPAPDRALQSRGAGDHRPALDRRAARRARHHEEPRPLVSLSTPAREKSAPCRCCIRPICCARRSASGSPGATCWRSRRRSAEQRAAHRASKRSIRRPPARSQTGVQGEHARRRSRNPPESGRISSRRLRRSRSTAGIDR